MKSLCKLGLLLAASLGFALTASGQGRGLAAPMRGFSTPVRGLSAPARSLPVRTGPPSAFRGARAQSSGVRPRLVRPRGAGRGSFRNDGFGNGFCNSFEECENGFFPPPITASPQEPNFGLVNGVPGLGFDFPHLAAINRGFNSQGGFLSGFNNRFNNFGFIPFFESLPLYYPPYEEEETPDYYTQAAQQPQFAVPSPQQRFVPPAQAAPSASAPAPQAPPPELGQLILVRRDGQVLLAAAFTVRNGQLTYITSEGTRRTFSLTDLDKDATRQMNEANGTTVSLPD